MTRACRHLHDSQARRQRYGAARQPEPVTLPSPRTGRRLRSVPQPKTEIPSQADFAALASEYTPRFGLADGPAGGPLDSSGCSGPVLELHIETGTHQVQRSESLPMKRCLQGELDERSKQVAFWLGQGWIACVHVCAEAGLSAIPARSMEPLTCVNHSSTRCAARTSPPSLT